MLGIGMLLVSVAAGAAAAGLQVGDQAPAFSMVGSDGKTYSLEQFKGKSAVVVAWFPKAFTGGCTKECKSLRENSKALHELKVAYFTASVDKPEDNKKFAESLDLDYPILSDPDKTVATAYGVLSERGYANRWTFYIDKEGVIREIDKSVRAPQAGPDVAAKIKDLKLASE
jgi:peroxiredoxin Q/BCP